MSKLSVQDYNHLSPESPTLPMMDPKSIELCARKVSAASGDLRMALDMCRRAIELVESEELKRRESPLQETTYNLLHHHLHQ